MFYNPRKRPKQRIPKGQKYRQNNTTAGDFMKNSFDVIVAGGGPAGCAAALAAARSGLKTLIIERNSCLGGMGAAGLVPSWCPVHKELYSPLILEIYEASFN